MRISPFQALYPNFDFIASPDSFCDDAKESYQEFKNNGFFEKSPQDALYIYQITNFNRTHIGLIALADVHDFLDGHIKKHENTLSEKEQHQMQLFLKWNAILKPILLAHQPVPEIQSILHAYIVEHDPLFETGFERDGQLHTVWAINDGQIIHRLQELFLRNVPSTYIADGHHRTTTVALLHQRLKDKRDDMDFSRLFCAFFSSDQLSILDFNRVIDALQNISVTRFIIQLSKVFNIDVLKEGRRPKSKHEIVMLLQEEWYSLKWKKEILKNTPKNDIALDATLLNEYVVRDILDIQDVRTDSRISYVDGTKTIQTIEKLVNLPTKVAFVLFPVTFSDMMHLADQGKVLPPKSTYFEPRMKSGILVKTLKQ